MPILSSCVGSMIVLDDTTEDTYHTLSAVPERSSFDLLSQEKNSTKIGQEVHEKKQITYDVLKEKKHEIIKTHQSFYTENKKIRDHHYLKTEINS